MVRQLVPVFDDRIMKGVHVVVSFDIRLEKRCRVLVRVTKARVNLK